MAQPAIVPFVQHQAPRGPRRLLAALLSFGAALPLAAFDSAVPPAQRSAVLVSWDGVGRERLRELLAAGRLPGVSALVRDGSQVDVDVTDHRTDTKAGHAEMLTGYGPEVTGVRSNTRSRPIPAGLSVFEALQRRFGSDRIATIMITAKAGNLGSAGPGFLRRGQPWSLVRPSLTVWDGDALRDASVVGQLALACLRRFAGQRFFAFFHFGDADRAGHQKGERSDPYAEAIVSCDRWLNAIAAELRALAVDRTTMVFVTADHGFDLARREHRDAPRVFLATDDPAVVRGGDQRDIVPTLLAELGADPAAVRPTLAGLPLTSIGPPESPTQ
ncbi:MAG: alkaline phosphatase family protein [Spirochaetes bacterium]|nr:alkaline phosphatase family protein [Spirochaetota bacterium]